MAGRGSGSLATASSENIWRKPWHRAVSLRCRISSVPRPRCCQWSATVTAHSQCCASPLALQRLTPTSRSAPLSCASATSAMPWLKSRLTRWSSSAGLASRISPGKRKQRAGRQPRDEVAFARAVLGADRTHRHVAAVAERFDPVLAGQRGKRGRRRCGSRDGRSGHAAISGGGAARRRHAGDADRHRFTPPPPAWIDRRQAERHRASQPASLRRTGLAWLPHSCASRSGRRICTDLRFTARMPAASIRLNRRLTVSTTSPR